MELPDESTYHLISVVPGSLAGVAALVGLLILIYRRINVPRVSATTTTIDLLVYLLLLITIGIGVLETVGVNLLGGGYDYRLTVALWYRGLFTFTPHPDLMSSVPLVYQLHAISAWLLCALWPFSRLVHIWSVPVTYLRRSHILYRVRN